jgi:hypothetical protein
VSKVAKTLERVLRGNADANVAFRDLCALLRELGFAERIRGDHHIFSRTGVVEILNLQPRGGKAKPYQVKQVRDVIVSYRLVDAADAESDENEENRGEEKPQEEGREG